MIGGPERLGERGGWLLYRLGNMSVEGADAALRSWIRWTRFLRRTLTKIHIDLVRRPDGLANPVDGIAFVDQVELRMRIALI